MTKVVLNVWPAIFTIDLARYLIGAGAVYVSVWVWWRRSLMARRIQASWPAASDVRREIKYSLLTVLIFSFVGFGMFLGVRAGVLRVYSEIGDYGWLWWAASVIVLIVLHDAYFYWTHRLLHHRALFRWAHRTHHRSRTPTPWAAYAFDPAEALVQAAFLPLVLTILPAHDSAIFLFLAHMIARNAIGHCGFELMPRGLARRRRWQPLATVTHHDLHHSTMNWNYGLYFTWWDRLMGTEHARYLERLEAVTGDSSTERKEARMSMRTILLAAALVIFLAQTVMVLAGVGFTGFFESANLNHATRLMFLDLVITLTLIGLWMWKDAAASGRNVVPYLVLTLLLGSAGPLLYLLVSCVRKRDTSLAHGELVEP